MKVAAEQMLWATLAICGFGFTLTVMVKVSVQTVGAVPTEAVTVYTTLIAVEVEFDKLWLILACPIV